MKIDVKVILIILSASSLLGITYNYFSDTGIPLIAEEKILKWAEDSLFTETHNLDNIQPDSIGNENQTTEYLETKKNQPEQEQLNNKEIPKNNIEMIDTPNQKKEPEQTEPAAIHHKQAFQLYKQNVLFIDAREPEDYKTAHIKNAINLPMDQFEDFEYILEEIDKDQKIVTYCAGTDCDLSIVLANVLFDRGYKNLFVFFGGWIEWTEADYPVEKGKAE